MSLALVLTVGPLPSAGATAPSNNDFASAQVVGALPFTVTQSTVDATVQGGESSPSCAGLGASVWFSYTPSTAATLTADTYGSGYDTVLGVWAGSSLGSLVEVDCSDDAIGTRSAVTFEAEGGVTYRFQVGGFSGATGSLTFNLVAAPPPPDNDDFADAEIIDSVPTTLNRTNVDATLEDGEPGPSYLKSSVWFGYTATATGLLIADTAGSDFETKMGVWTGTQLGNLVEVDVDETYSPPDYDQVKLTFTGQAGVRYWFQVGGYYEDTGSLVFTLTAPGSISGTVLDADTGQPAAYVSVEAYPVGDTTLARSTSTDASGNYMLERLSAGDYNVYFSGIGYRYLPQWWDAKASSATADTVTVQWATTATGIDADLTLNDDPAAGVYWELYDCDSDALTSHFADTTSCYRLWTDRYLFYPYASHPYAAMIVTAPGGGDASFPCPVTPPCTPTQTLYNGGQIAGYYWYWFISGENRVAGTYDLEICGGSSSLHCDHHLITTTFTITDPDPPATCHGLVATKVGTPGDDVLNGTDGDDVIVGFGGNDTINGRGGNDTICAGNGSDTVKGGAGKDRIYGGGGADTIYGGGGKDKLYGDAGKDVIFGGNAGDKIEGGARNDKLTGDGGDDTIIGGKGTADVADGSTGVDTCVAETVKRCEL